MMLPDASRSLRCAGHLGARFHLLFPLDTAGSRHKDQGTVAAPSGLVSRRSGSQRAADHVG